jgi:hypothetical protein
MLDPRPGAATEVHSQLVDTCEIIQHEVCSRGLLVRANHPRRVPQLHAQPQRAQKTARADEASPIPLLIRCISHETAGFTR